MIGKRAAARSRGIWGPGPDRSAGARSGQTAALTVPPSTDASAFVKPPPTGLPLASALWGRLRRRKAYPEVRAALRCSGPQSRLHRISRRRVTNFWATTRLVELTATAEQHAGHLAPSTCLREPPFIWPAHWQSVSPGSRRAKLTPAHRSSCRRVPTFAPAGPRIDRLTPAISGLWDRPCDAADGSAPVAQLPGVT